MGLVKLEYLQINDRALTMDYFYSSCTISAFSYCSLSLSSPWCLRMATSFSFSTASSIFLTCSVFSSSWLSVCKSCLRFSFCRLVSSHWSRSRLKYSIFFSYSQKIYLSLSVACFMSYNMFASSFIESDVWSRTSLLAPLSIFNWFICYLCP